MFTTFRFCRTDESGPGPFFTDSTTAAPLRSAPHVSKCAPDIHVSVETKLDTTAPLVPKISIFFSSGHRS